MSAFEIRRFRADEAEAWRAIRLEALRTVPEAFGDAYEDAIARPFDHYERTVSDPFSPFAAFENEKPIGTACLRVQAGSKVSHQGYVWGVIVSPPHQGRGLGRALMRAVIDHASGQVEQLHLSVSVTQTAAFELYQSLGFVGYGIEPRALKIAGRYHDEILMVRMLDRRYDISSAPTSVR
jgi:ribosomal protein S18 acetylase RimI-like enzyme